MKNTEQVLKDLSALDTAWRQNKVDIAERIRQQVETELAAQELQRAKLAAEAERLGCSKSSIGRAIKTSDWRTITEVVERGRGYLTEETVYVEKYRWGVLRFAKKDTIYIHLLVDGRNDRTKLADNPEGDGLLMHFDLEYENKSGIKGIDQYSDAALYQEARAWAMDNRDELVQRIKAGEIPARLDGVTPDVEQYWVPEGEVSRQANEDEWNESEEEEVEWLG